MEYNGFDASVLRELAVIHAGVTWAPSESDTTTAKLAASMPPHSHTDPVTDVPACGRIVLLYSGDDDDGEESYPDASEGYGRGDEQVDALAGGLHQLYQGPGHQPLSILESEAD